MYHVRSLIHSNLVPKLSLLKEEACYYKFEKMHFNKIPELLCCDKVSCLES